MKRHLMVAGAIAVLCLAACDARTTAEHPAATAAVAADAAERDAAATDAAAMRIVEPASQPEPTKEPEWTYERTDRYREYHLIQLSGPAIEGRDFEAKIMCKNVFEAADYNMWALQNLTLTGSRAGMTSFMALSDGQPVEISLVMDEERHVPSYLMMGGAVIASCRHSIAYQ